ncbi:MAG: hypothetical protein ABJN73_07305 [Nonlabens ulvanivorans]
MITGYYVSLPKKIISKDSRFNPKNDLYSIFAFKLINDKEAWYTNKIEHKPFIRDFIWDGNNFDTNSSLEKIKIVDKNKMIWINDYKGGKNRVFNLFSSLTENTRICENSLLFISFDKLKNYSNHSFENTLTYDLFFKN